MKKIIPTLANWINTRFDMHHIMDKRILKLKGAPGGTP